MSTRDNIRKATVGAKKEFRKELTEWDGLEVEVRQPSVLSRRELLNACSDEEGNVDGQELMIWALIQNTYVPGTDEKVFDRADYDSIVNQPTGGFVDHFGKVALEVMNVGGAEKNFSDSEATADSKTS